MKTDLSSAISGRVLPPGDGEFAAAARPWNLAVEQPAAAVVGDPYWALG